MRGEWRTGKGKYTGVSCVVKECERPLRDFPICGYHKLRIRTRKDDPIPGVYEKVNGACTEDECTRVSNRRNLCDRHYSALGRISETPLRGKHVIGSSCFVEGCEKPSTSFGMCKYHRRFQRTYKVSEEVFINFWKDPRCQNPKCGRTDKIHIDHDHDTGQFRGFLCVGCNISLGHLLESPERAKGLVEYMNDRDIE